MAYTFASHLQMLLSQAWQWLMSSRLAIWLGLSHEERFSQLNATLPNIAKRLEGFLESGDTVVDFNSMDNVFLPLLKQQCLKQGKQINCRAFDILIPSNKENFARRSWFDVKQGELPEGDHLVIGLAPPIGRGNALANKFIEHSVGRFRPRLLALISPHTVPVPDGYATLHEDAGETVFGKTFRILTRVGQ